MKIITKEENLVVQERVDNYERDICEQAGEAGSMSQ
jgi:hypothetical protein